MRSLVAVGGLVAAVTALSLALGPVLDPADVVMLYLLGVVLAAYAFGRIPSLLATGLSVAAYNFFFVLPYFTFAVDDARHLVSFGVLLVVGWVVATTSERLRKEQADAAAAEVRARTEELRSALLSTVSHDLRTPLAAIVGSATTLRDTPTLPADERDGLLDAIRTEALRIERLVTNLLELTRLQSATQPPKAEWVPVDELVGAALARVDGRAIATAVPASLPLLRVDPVLVEHALVNLLQNAVRHTAPGTPVTLAAESTADDEVVLEVRDAGPGFGPDPEALLAPFVTGPRSTGTGLGLAIARGVADAHGGRLELRSERGAVARLHLPAGTPPRPEEPG